MRTLLYTFIFSLSLSLSLNTAMAQENKGTLIPAKIIQRSLMLGGSITGSYKSLTNNLGAEEKSGSRLQVDVDAKVGYFVLHDLALGGRAAVTHYKRRESSDQLFERRTYILAGPFVRYYLNNGFFGEGSFSYGVNNQTNGIKSDLYETKGGLGYALFINPKISIEPMVNVTYLKERRIDGSSSNRYLTELGPSFSIGMQIYLFRENPLTLW